MDLGFDLSQAMAHDSMYAGELSFARRPYSRDLKGVDIAVVGIPFDMGTANRAGTRFGPRAIREQSALVGCYPWGLWPWDFNVFSERRVIDYSDIAFTPGYPDRMVDVVRTHVAGILGAGVRVLALGGDHMVSYPLLQAHHEKFGPLSLIHFDAHSDTWDMGDDLNHGTAFFLAQKAGLIAASRSIQVGIRTPNPDTHGFHIRHANQLLDEPIGRTVEAIRDVVGSHAAYLTFDTDFLDPAFAPGTGTPVVGGPSTYQARQILHGLRGLNIVGGDQVEVSPPYDGPGQVTALAGATVALDILHLMSAAL